MPIMARTKKTALTKFFDIYINNRFFVVAYSVHISDTVYNFVFFSFFDFLPPMNIIGDD